MMIHNDKQKKINYYYYSYPFSIMQYLWVYSFWYDTTSFTFLLFMIYYNKLL